MKDFLMDSASIAFVIITVYIMIGLIFKMVRRKTVAQYSPLDIVSLFIFAGLVENSVTALAGNIMPEAILSGACFIVLFHYWFSSTKLYMRIFPLSRYVLVKNGTIDTNAVVPLS